MAVLIVYVLFPPQALGTLKQKVRKYNKDFEKDIQSYRENPVTSDAEQASKLYLLNITSSISIWRIANKVGSDKWQINYKVGQTFTEIVQSPLH